MKNITIAGELGSGKTTVSNYLITKIDYKIVSAGMIFRNMAMKHNMSAKEFNEFIENDPHYDNYVDDYQATVGHVPYNTSFEKAFLEGSNNRCELVPLANKANSPFIHLTTKSNMLVGFGNGADKEKILVEKHHAFKLDFIATMFFGAEFETISKERLLVGTIDGTTSVVAGIGG